MQATDQNPSSRRLTLSDVYHLADAAPGSDLTITPPAGKISSIIDLSFTFSAGIGGLNRYIILQAVVDGTTTQISAPVFTVPPTVTVYYSFSTNKIIPTATANLIITSPIPKNLFLSDTDSFILHIGNVQALDLIYDIMIAYDSIIL